MIFENASLPLLAAVMGAIDGFNVCSIGALIFILALVLGFKSRKMMLIAGSTFILTAVLVYGLLMLLWHRIFVFLLSYRIFFEIFLGSVALAGALYLLKIFIDAIRFGPTCKIQGSAIVNRAYQKLENAFQKGNYLTIAAGIVFFAVLITIIEFPCSAALPLTYVGLVTDAGTPFILVIIYVLIYLFMYMADEVTVFLIALFTKKIWVSSPKLITVSSFLGSVILFMIAAYHLFRISFF